MKLHLITAAVGLAFLSTPALADHVYNLDEPHASRGACEARMAELAKHDRKWLAASFPHLFSGVGDSSSFLTRAFECGYDDEDGAWYIGDHRMEVMQSDWWTRRP